MTQSNVCDVLRHDDVCKPCSQLGLGQCERWPMGIWEGGAFMIPQRNKEKMEKKKQQQNNICLFVIADIWALTAAIQDIVVQLEDKAACLMSQWVK